MHNYFPKRCWYTTICHKFLHEHLFHAYHLGMRDAFHNPWYPLITAHSILWHCSPVVLLSIYSRAWHSWRNTVFSTNLYKQALGWLIQVSCNKKVAHHLLLCSVTISHRTLFVPEKLKEFVNKTTYLQSFGLGEEEGYFLRIFSPIHISNQNLHPWINLKNFYGKLFISLESSNTFPPWPE